MRRALAAQHAREAGEGGQPAEIVVAGAADEAVNGVYMLTQALPLTPADLALSSPRSRPDLGLTTRPT